MSWSTTGQLILLALVATICVTAVLRTIASIATERELLGRAKTLPLRAARTQDGKPGRNEGP